MPSYKSSRRFVAQVDQVGYEVVQSAKVPSPISAYVLRRCVNLRWLLVILVMICCSFAAVPADALPPAGIVSDDFNVACDDLLGFWTFVDPVGDSTYALMGVGTSDAQLHLTVPAGTTHDAWVSGLQAPRLMQAVNDTDFELEVKFDSTVSQQYQGQGLIVEASETHFLRFDVYSDGAQMRLFAAAITNSQATILHNSPITAGTPLYMRVQRVGAQWTQQYSSDGQTWQTGATFTHALSVSAVGVFALNAGSNAPAHTAVVDYVFATAAPIVPEDGTVLGDASDKTLSVSSSGSGTVVVEPELPVYTCGQAVTLTAMPEAGHTFVAWSGDVTSTSNPLTVYMTDNQVITGVFEADTTAPTISGIAIEAGQTAAIITWSTDEPATSRVDFGETLAYELGFVESTELVTTHSVTLTGLTPEMTYHAVVTSADANGMTASSDDLTFQQSAILPPPPSGFISDDFNVACNELQGVWTFVDPVGDSTYALTGVGTSDAQFHLTVPAGTSHDAWVSGFNAPRIIQAVNDTDFELEVKFESLVSQSYQGQGIVVQASETHFLRFDVYSDGAQAHLFAARIESGAATILHNSPITAGTPLYMRVQRVGAQWTQQYSSDGQTWQTGATFTHALSVSAVGVFALNAGSNAPAHTAVVDYVFATAAPIVPEDGAVLGDTSDKTLTVSNSGSGTVVVEPELPTYTCGQTVTLTAVPEPGYAFVEWSGDVAGTSNPLTVYMTDNQVITGVFQSDVMSPTISGIEVQPGQTAAIITWTTDEPATSRVDFGETLAYELGFVENTALVTTHSVTLTGLASETLYHIMVTSANADGQASSSADQTFSTTQDSPLPVISNINITVTATTATVTWDTDLLATSHVDYGETSSYELGSVDDSTLVTHRSMTLNGLKPETVYHVMISSANADGQASSSTDQLLMTNGAVLPNVTNIHVTSTATTATITWDTESPATSRVDYGETPSYELGFVEEPTLVTSHSLTLTDLLPETLYHFMITSQNDEGLSNTDDMSFTTASPSPSGIISDDFNVACNGLLGFWTFIDPIGDSTYALTGVGTSDAQLHLSVPAGTSHDAWGSGFDAPRIIQAVNDTDFELEAKFDSTVSQQYQGQGLVLQASETHFLRFDVYSDGAQMYLFAAVITDGQATIMHNSPIAAGAPLYLRVQRVGAQWTQQYSYDGQEWTLGATFAHAMTVSAVGVFALNVGSSAPAHTAVVDYVFATATPIVPEDGTVLQGDKTLTVNSSGSGTVMVEPELSTYTCGQAVTLTAVPEPGHTFVGWSETALGTSETVTVYMVDDQVVTGLFQLDVTPPTISGIEVQAGQTAAIITWSTDEPATSRVDFGETPVYELGFVESTELVMTHSVTLTGLTPEMTYHAVVTSADANGMVASSDDFTFQQSATAPVIDIEAPSVPGNLVAQTLSASQIALTWTAATDNVAVTGYQVFRDGVDVAFTDASTTQYTDTSLAPSTSYTYTIVAVDATGNESLPSAPATATTNELLLDPTLVAVYGLEEDSGDTVVDSSGNGHNGTLVGGTTLNASGQFGTAVDFHSGYIDLGALDIVGNELTIAAWVNVETFTNPDARIISKATGIASQDHWWMLSLINADHQLRFRLKTVPSVGIQTLIAEGPGVQAGVWTHVAATYDGTVMRLYQDGVEVGSRGHSGAVATDATVSAWIGAGPGGGPAFDGRIDEVWLYSRALSPAEIADLMTTPPTPDVTPPEVTNELIGQPVSTTGIALHWSPATDNIGVTEYTIFRDNVIVGTTAETFFFDTGLSAFTPYAYTVEAHDAAGNGSGPSTALSVTTLANDDDEWWNASWNYRVPVVVDPLMVRRTDSPVQIALDFTAFLTNLGVSDAMDVNSIRVIEVNAAGQVIDADVPFQFDPNPDFDPSINATGELVLIAQGIAPATALRFYHVYFDVAGLGFAPPSVADQITLVDNVLDEGLNSYEISTQLGTYYYQKNAGGFSSLLDPQGNDWIDHHPGGGSAGEFRGIPNLVFPEGHFHPGATTATSTIVRQGPVLVEIHSVTNDSLWESTWTIFPRHIRLTVQRTDHDYWFLYEGTPGGALDLQSDYVVRSNGAQTLVAEPWEGDLVGDEWVYVVDPVVGRGLFVANHTDDTAVDSYFQLDGNMTVFGFGRQGLNASLSAVPAQLTLGFVENPAFDAAAGTITSAYKELSVLAGSPVQQGSVMEQPSTPQNLAAVPLSHEQVQLTWEASSDNVAISEYQILRDGNVIGTTRATTFLDIGLTESTFYTYAVVALDVQGNASPSVAAVQVTTPINPGPSIDFWYGTQQSFGVLGEPQVWINVLGKISDADGVASATYTLNGGFGNSLALGPDTLRLEADGDFNIDLSFIELNIGPNEIAITATDLLGNVTIQSVSIDYPGGVVWPLPYSIDWSAVVDIQDVAQVVDGYWELEPAGMRTVELGYDRIVAIGDLGWTNYEITVPITVHGRSQVCAQTPSSCSGLPPGVGLIARWQGHYEWDSVRPRWGWYPLGALGWFRFTGAGSQGRFRMIGGDDGRILATGPNTSLPFGTTYVFKLRVETVGGQHQYSFKAWPQAEAEPAQWLLIGNTAATELASGSALLLAHHVDATFGNVEITPIP